MPEKQPKPYTARSLPAAQRRVRELVKLNATLMDLLERYGNDRKLLAKLAAKGPAFDSPLKAWAAEKIRDGILANLGLNPDGSFKKG